MEYGCLISNKFKLLSDDETEDPFESLQKAEQAKKDKPVQKKDKKAAAVAVKQAPVIAAQSPKAEPEKPQQQRQANKENESRENRGGQRGGARGGGGRGRVNFAEKKDVGNRQSEGGQDVMGERFGESRPQRGGGRGGAGGGRGGGGFRGGPRRGYGGRGGSDRPVDTHDSGFRSGGETEDEHRPRGGGGGRVYRGGGRRGFAARGGDRHPGGDRHSGSDRTGVRAQPKRDGHGKGNWGTENDELVGETEPMAPVTDAELVKPEDHQEGEEGAKEAEEKKAEDEKAKELTLQEYRALHQKTDQPAFQTRRAGEGQDQKIYSKLVPLKKEEEPEEHEEIIVVRREPREKPLNIEVSFSDINRSRGGGNSGGGERGYRGGRDRDDYNRGGSRGGDRREFRGDRGGRGGRRNNFAMSDDAFPALGGKA